MTVTITLTDVPINVLAIETPKARTKLALSRIC